jgi:hypothetical protein
MITILNQAQNDNSLVAAFAFSFLRLPLATVAAYSTANSVLGRPHLNHKFHLHETYVLAHSQMVS